MTRECVILILILVSLLSNTCCNNSSESKLAKPEAINRPKTIKEQINELIELHIGKGLVVNDRDGQPLHYIGKFNDDSFDDIAIFVSKEVSLPSFLPFRDVVFSDPEAEFFRTMEGYDITQDLKSDFSAIVIIHGDQSGWFTKEPLGKYLLLNVGYPLYIKRKGERSKEKKYPIPKQAKGDAIYCSGEGAGDGYIYFDGNKCL